MSLLQRVSSFEGLDRQLPPEWEQENNTHEPGNEYGTTDHRGSIRRRSRLGHRTSHKSLRRVISYDAIPKPSQPSHSTHPQGGVAPYKISTPRRIAQVVATVVSCWLGSGVVFGFAALKPVLVSSGVYRDLCTLQEIQDGVPVCYEQDLRLNVFFAVASTTCNISALIVGAILDRFGPRVAITFGSLFLALGGLLMGLAFSLPEFDGYLIANLFLALGGTFVFVPSFSIANAFPMFAGTIVAAVTGAFDASAAVFLIYRLIYDSTDGRFTPQKFFFGYLVVPLFILLVQVFLMTPHGYKTVPQLEEKLERAEDVTRDVHDSDDELSDRELRELRAQRCERRESRIQDVESILGDADFRENKAIKQEERHETSGVWGALHGRSALQQVMSPWFLFITLLTVLQMLRMNFLIATIRSQYEYMLGSERLAKQVNTFFDIALPIGGVATTPFIGLLLDNFSVASVLAILVALTTACGIFGSLPCLWAAYINVILFVILRPLYYSAMSDYAAKVFGFATFGRVYGESFPKYPPYSTRSDSQPGLIICLSGIVNLGQPFLDAVNHDVFHDNPIPINIVLAALGLIIGTILVAWVRMHSDVGPTQPGMTTIAERQPLIPESIREDESEADWS